MELIVRWDVFDKDFYLIMIITINPEQVIPTSIFLTNENPIYQPHCGGMKKSQGLINPR